MLAACLSACGSKQDSSEPAANTSDSSTKDTASTGSGELVIGGVGPLTGDYAVYGNAVKNGAQIAVDEINAVLDSIAIDVYKRQILDTAILAVSIFVISIISLLAILGLQVSLVLLVSGLLMQAILILVLLGRTNMPNRRNARFPVPQRREDEAAVRRVL